MRAALSKIFTARPHGVALVLLTLIFLSLNLFSNLALRNARLDLTENGLFTLSDGTRNIVAGLQEPVRLKFYYSRSIAANQPGLRVEAQRVRDMLEEITMAADGMVQLEIIDPEPFSEAEDQAVAQGLVARPVAEGRSSISALSAPIWSIMSKSFPILRPSGSNIWNMMWRGYCIIWRARKNRCSALFPICRSIPAPAALWRRCAANRSRF